MAALKLVTSMPGIVLLLLGGCAATTPTRQVAVPRTAASPAPPPPQWDATKPGVLTEARESAGRLGGAARKGAQTMRSSAGKVKSTVSAEAREGAERLVDVARKGADTMRSGAGKVISGADKVISLAHFKSSSSVYPYDVCAQQGELSGQGFCWPAYGTVSRGFKRGHYGLDVLAPTGTPVYAAKAGTVIYAGKKLSGFGNVVVLDHGCKVATIYGHNSKLLVQTGDTVRCGEQIACVGMTGRATAPHCHFEIREDGTPVDPKPLLP
ncbi:MAG: peptidoglycan DD-metalloendopeptidase family protein [Candidatus Sumerlaeaceae bacterium]